MDNDPGFSWYDDDTYDVAVRMNVTRHKCTDCGHCQRIVSYKTKEVHYECKFLKVRCDDKIQLCPDFIQSDKHLTILKDLSKSDYVLIEKNKYLATMQTFSICYESFMYGGGEEL